MFRLCYEALAVSGTRKVACRSQKHILKKVMPCSRLAVVVETRSRDSRGALTGGPQHSSVNATAGPWEGRTSHQVSVNAESALSNNPSRNRCLDAYISQDDGHWSASLTITRVHVSEGTLFFKLRKQVWKEMVIQY